MLFNSFEFLVFLPLVFFLYWGILKNKTNAQNLLMLISSYVFYGWWDWRFLFLLAFSSSVDFIIGILLSRTKSKLHRKVVLSISLISNLSLLGFFKYYNFFIESLQDSFHTIGYNLDVNTLYIILPVGISFYTFQTLSYTIDIYREKIKPCKDPIIFFAFVSFFPQLVAGPIERASNLLPQFISKRTFNFEDSKEGIRKIIWGLFKNIVIADNLGIYVSEIFDNHESLSGSVLFLGLSYFAFQIYCDFSGYSDIAIGTARLFGFKLMRNFAYPYFARDMAEHWRRWHISLSTWFKDYLYIPLGGSRGGTWGKIRNTVIIFTVSGFWHGADWTYVIWGFVNGLYFLPLLLYGINRNHMGVTSEGRIFPTLKDFMLMVSTFVLKTFTYVFFRAEDIGQSFSYMKQMFRWSFFAIPEVHFLSPLPILIIFILIEWWKRDKDCPLEIGEIKKVYRFAVYILVCAMTIIYTSSGSNEFIYFQF